MHVRGLCLCPTCIARLGDKADEESVRALAAIGATSAARLRKATKTAVVNGVVSIGASGGLRGGLGVVR